jgi:hypothetical protein
MNNKTLKYKEASPAWDFGPLLQLTSESAPDARAPPRTLADLSFHKPYGLTAYASAGRVSRLIRFSIRDL